MLILECDGTLLPDECCLADAHLGRASAAGSEQPQLLVGYLRSFAGTMFTFHLYTRPALPSAVACDGQTCAE